MRRLEVLDQWPLAFAAENGEVVHLIARCRDAGVVAAANLDRRAVDDLIGMPEPVVVDLQELQPEAVLRPKAEIVDLVMVALDRWTVGVVLVRGKSGPATGADGEQLRHEEPPDPAGRTLAEDMLDLAVGLGFVGAVLDLVDVGGPHNE